MHYPRSLLSIAVLAAVLLLPTTAPAASPTAADTPERWKVEVLATYPHDPGAFTQGLVLDGDALYESTGLEGRSSLRQVELESGKVLRKIDVPLPYFGEGLALANGQLIQLTWQHGTAFVYDAFSFSERRRFSYGGEGWGLSSKGDELVMSSGSDELSFRDPTTFNERRKLPVRNAGKPIRRLNELEWVGDLIYANIWMTRSIAVIDAATGKARAMIDAGHLLTRQEEANADVLNGIAFDAKSGNFLITGKLWPKLFRVRFLPASPAAPQ